MNFLGYAWWKGMGCGLMEGAVEVNLTVCGHAKSKGMGEKVMG